MKKILLFFVVFLITTNVKAIEVTDWMDFYDESRQISETEIRYKFYRYQKITKEFAKNQNQEPYLYFDSSIPYNYGSFSNWQNNCPVSPSIFDIEYKVFYPYTKKVDFKYLILKNFSEELIIDNIIMFKGTDELDINYIKCINCDSNENIKVNNNATVIYELNNYYTIDNINFKIFSTNLQQEVTFMIYLSNDIEMTKTASENSGSNYINDYVVTKDWFYNATDSEIIYSEEPIESDLNRISMNIYGELERCRYRPIFATYWASIKTYYNNGDYVTNDSINGYTKELESAKTYYKYVIEDDKTNIKEKTTEDIDINKDKEEDIVTIVEDNDIIEEPSINEDIEQIENIYLDDNIQWQNVEEIESNVINEIEDNKALLAKEKTNSLKVDTTIKEDNHPLINLLSLSKTSLFRVIFLIFIVAIISLIYIKCKKNVD